MLSRFYLPVAVFVIHCGQPSIAQEPPSLSEPTFELDLLPDGTFKLERKADTDSSFAEPVPEKAITTLEGKHDLAYEPYTKLLQGQDWYAVRDRTGYPTAVYSVPRGTELPDTVFMNMSTGQSLEKVEPWWLERVMLSEEQITGILERLHQNARSAVCNMSGRPSRFGTEVDISAGIGIQGRIAFSVEWETADLCS